MNSNERIDEFLRLQDKGISLEEIASNLGIKPQTLKRNLNRNGYKNVKGKYLKKELSEKNTSVQVAFEDTNLNEKTNKKTTKVTQLNDKQNQGEQVNKVAKSNNRGKTTKSNQENKAVKPKQQDKIAKSNAGNKTVKPKKDRKINLTQEDLDKLCEVYDWYLEVKDCKSLKRKSRKKEIAIDFEHTEDKNVSLKIDKGVWEDFLRLCSNSGYDRKTLVTQALNDFMKTHKDLL